MHRSYLPQADFSNNSIIIKDSNEVHHLINVLHFSVGDQFEVFNSHSQMATVAVERIDEREVVCKVITVREMSVKGARIILACAIPKGAKFEDIVEKATELGVDEIIPIMTARTEVIYKDDKAIEKVARFNKIAISAAKQCGRGQLPIIHPVQDLAGALRLIPKAAIKLFPSLHGHTLHIRKALSLASPEAVVAIFIGPEGDFTPKEVEQAIKAGCQPVTLGATVLRVDTAAISTVALVRYLLRD